MGFLELLLLLSSSSSSSSPLCKVLIYTDIPETNYVPRDYSVTAILLLLFMVLISLVLVLNLLYFYISTFRSMCAVPNMAVLCSLLFLLLSLSDVIIIIIISIIIIIITSFMQDI